eukprot:1184156-Prorocentrum_minimum.AAC.1
MLSITPRQGGDLGAEDKRSTTFETNELGYSVGSFEVNTGFQYAANVGKAVTLHDDKDTTVACGVLEAQYVDVSTPSIIV